MARLAAAEALPLPRELQRTGLAASVWGEEILVFGGKGGRGGRYLFPCPPEHQGASTCPSVDRLGTCLPPCLPSRLAACSPPVVTVCNMWYMLAAIHSSRTSGPTTPPAAPGSASAQRRRSPGARTPRPAWSAARCGALCACTHPARLVLELAAYAACRPWVLCCSRGGSLAHHV